MRGLLVSKKLFCEFSLTAAVTAAVSLTPAKSFALGETSCWRIFQSDPFSQPWESGISNAALYPVFSENGFDPTALFNWKPKIPISAEVLEARLTKVNELRAQKIGLTKANIEFQKVNLIRDAVWLDRAYGGRALKLLIRLPEDSKVVLMPSRSRVDARTVFITGDYVFDSKPGLAAGNQETKMHRFEGTQLKESLSLREFLINQIPDGTVSIFRVMNEHEHGLWTQKDPAKLMSRATFPNSMNYFDVPTYHFAVGKTADYFLKGMSTTVLRIDVPKPALVKMAKQGKVDAGFVGEIFELSFKYEALDELVSFVP